MGGANKGHPLPDSFIYGSTSPKARTVLIYGNCQVPYLARMLAALDDLDGEYRFAVALNHTQPGQSEADTVSDALLADLALVLWQFEDRANNPAALALRERLPAGCPVVRFPTYLLTCLWPFECPEPRVVSEPDYPWGRFPMGDMIGLEIAQAGLSGPLAVAAYLDLSAQKMPDLQRRYERDLARMQLHDSNCDVKLADYVQAGFRREHMFWTNGHVSDAAIGELAARVADAARPWLGGDAARARLRLREAGRFGGMGGLQLPIHPVVAQTLGLDWYELDRPWAWYEQRWTYFEYIERYIAYDTGW